MISVRENALMAYRHKVPQWVPMAGLDTELFLAYPEMERYVYDKQGTDAFGVEWTYVPQVGAPTPTPNKILLDDITRWREVVRIPDVEKIDWETISHRDLHANHSPENSGKGVLPRADGKSILDVDKARVCIVLNGMFERLHACMGMENALCALLEEPEACYDFFGAIADYKIAYFKKIKQYYHADVINAHDDYGTALNMFMSPSLWRELLKPHLKRIVDACHEVGLIYQHHSCGYYQDIVDDMVEIGVDASDTWQVCNDRVREYKDKYQHCLTFIGGADNQGVFSRAGVTPEEAVAEYRRVMDLLAPGGSYILHTPGCTPQCRQAIVQAHLANRENYSA